MTKTFTLATVSTVATGVLFTKVDEVYDILDFMTGDSLYTHQLPRAAKVCRTWILKKYPDGNAISSL
jgi:hypothetical protein